MSEQQLKEFGARAVTLVDLPDFDDLDRRGRGLRVRRRAGVAAMLAVVVAVTGLTVTQNRRSHADGGPVNPPPSVKARPYQGATMKTLEAGTYELHPSRIESTLTADLTVPAGWNAWIGPNRYDGHAPGRSNEQALAHLSWYVGALVVEVDSVNTAGCGVGDGRELETTDDVVAALRRAFSTQVMQRPEQVHRFGYPATHLRMRVTGAAENCGEDPAIFHTTSDGFIQYADTGTVLDVWMLDVDGVPIYVQRAWTPNAPRTIRDQLDGVIDSIRIRNAPE